MTTPNPYRERALRRRAVLAAMAAEAERRAGLTDEQRAAEDEALFARASTYTTGRVYTDAEVAAAEREDAAVAARMRAIGGGR